jgi:membrane protein DedA with SNARE-associated domain
MEELIGKYGYFAVFVGTLLEGGTLLSMAGFLAHQGYLKLCPWVILAGFTGNYIDTLIFYILGRRGGQAVVKKHPAWRPRLDDLHRWLERYESLTVIGVRFIPGFRTVGAAAIGIADVPVVRFLLLNAVGAFLWASTVGICGFLFGRALKVIMGDLKHMELPILLGIGAAGLLTWAGFRLVSRHRARARGKASP